MWTLFGSVLQLRRRKRQPGCLKGADPRRDLPSAEYPVGKGHLSSRRQAPVLGLVLVWTEDLQRRRLSRDSHLEGFGQRLAISLSLQTLRRGRVLTTYLVHPHHKIFRISYKD